jgi:hypothetical protein
MGLRLVKYTAGSPGYHQYGPFALVDRSTNHLRFRGLDATAVEQMLFAEQFAEA